MVDAEESSCSDDPVDRSELPNEPLDWDFYRRFADLVDPEFALLCGPEVAFLGDSDRVALMDEDELPEVVVLFAFKVGGTWTVHGFCPSCETWEYAPPVDLCTNCGAADVTIGDYGGYLDEA